MIEQLGRFATAATALQRAGELAQTMVSMPMTVDQMAELEHLVAAITEEWLAARAELAKAIDKERQRMTGNHPN